jgi:hypothetical protein
MYLICVSESKIRQSVCNLRSELEVGTIVFEHVVKWRASEGEGKDILALQWLNATVSFPFAFILGLQALIKETASPCVRDIYAASVSRSGFESGQAGVVRSICSDFAHI